jgi:hypothetical protein
VSSVRKRFYQGFCQHHSETLAAAADFRARRPAMEALFSTIPGLEERSRRKAVAYLAGFFADIATDELVREGILRKCLG